MRIAILSALTLIACATAALAASPTSNGASNINPQDTRSTIAPALPAPNVADNDRPSHFLRAARGALAAGRSGEAQEALEMAQTRLLDRPVAMGHTNVPSRDPAVEAISQALQALAAGDRADCIRLIQAAIRTTSARGL
jgi:hypothetical protein